MASQHRSLSERGGEEGLVRGQDTSNLFNRLVLRISIMVMMMSESVCMCVCALCVQNLWRPEGGDGSPEVVVTEVSLSLTVGIGN